MNCVLKKGMSGEEGFKMDYALKKGHFRRRRIKNGLYPEKGYFRKRDWSERIQVNNLILKEKA